MNFEIFLLHWITSFIYIQTEINIVVSYSIVNHWLEIYISACQILHNSQYYGYILLGQLATESCRRFCIRVPSSLRERMKGFLSL